MEETQTAYEYLDDLVKQNKVKKPTFGTLWDFLDSKARIKGIPLNGQIELTPLCNFDCKMCYTHLTPVQMGERKLLSVDQWKSLLHEAWEAGMMGVNLTGGECLTYPGFEEVYLYLHSLGCEIRVLSNGALLDENWIRFLKEHPPAMLQITLYGGDEEAYERVTGHSGFAIVTANIQRAREAELPVSVIITPSRYLGEGVFDTIRAAQKLGVEYGINSYLMEPKEETGRAHLKHDLDIDEYRRIYIFRNELEGIETRTIDAEKLPPPGGPHHECDVKGLNCGAGRSCFTIEWDGKMLPCNSFRKVYGWPLEEGFLKVWKRIHEVCANWIQIPECIDCPYEKVCTNCSVRKEEFAEPGKQPYALCEQTKYLVQHGVRHIPACE